MKYDPRKVADKLIDFMCELNGISPISMGEIAYDTNSNFTMKYQVSPNKGNEVINSFLDKFKAAGIINSVELATAKIMENNNGITVNGDKCSLNLKCEPTESRVCITFKPKIKPEELYNYLDKAIKIAVRAASDEPEIKWLKEPTAQEITNTKNYDAKVVEAAAKKAKLAEDAKIAKAKQESQTRQNILKNAEPIPKSVEPICKYLEEKTENSFPHGDVKITYSSNKGQELEHSFEVTIKRETAGEEGYKLHGFIKELGMIVNKGGIIHELTTNDPERTGFRLDFDALLLSKDLKNNDGKNFSKIAQTSLCKY